MQFLIHYYTVKHENLPYTTDADYFTLCILVHCLKKTGYVTTQIHLKFYTVN